MIFKDYRKIVIIFITILICGIIAFILIAKEKQVPISDANNSSLNATDNYSASDSDSASSTVAIVDSGLNIGQIYPGGYELFAVTEYDYNVPNIYYVDDGIVEKGEYSGYHKIIAARTTDDMGGNNPTPFGFITKDYQTFLLTDYFNAGENVDKDWLGKQFNKKKVVGNAKGITFSHSETISLGNFVLVREYFIGEIPKDLKPLSGVNVPGLTFYYEPIADSNRGDAVFNTYVDTNTVVYVKDQSGAIFSYDPISKEMKERADNMTDNFSFYGLPFYKNSEITADSSIYKSYGSVFPSACGQTPSTYVLKNIDSNNLKKIGTTKYGVDLYVPLSSFESAVQYEYEIKIKNTSEYSGNGKVFFGEQYDQADPPTLDAYSKKNPVLIFKDAWGRWVGLGEYDYKLNGGCGKPVIYLYPETASEVNISIAKPITFTHDIPEYSNGWKVIAHPNGSITDLNKKTDCSLIDDSIFGLEYAKVACEKNNYPYIYWSGNIDNTYPNVSGGFVVKASELKATMTEKLNLIGLSEKEIGEMEEYWVPEMLKKNAPYYRITFFQTDDLNAFIPMDVTPKPQTEIRVFLDWSPLQSSIKIEPQLLQHIIRKGFTLVEWGGLRQ
ncbi:MAG: hypothetical protein V4469_05500 [Patescibacteria group bacterium]